MVRRPNVTGGDLFLPSTVKTRSRFIIFLAMSLELVGGACGACVCVCVCVPGRRADPWVPSSLGPCRTTGLHRASTHYILAMRPPPPPPLTAAAATMR